jgi:hypothetical protein
MRAGPQVWWQIAAFHDDARGMAVVQIGQRILDRAAQMGGQDAQIMLGA